jgi:hypothetical protein
MLVSIKEASQECGSRTVEHHQTLLNPQKLSMDLS